MQLPLQLFKAEQPNLGTISNWNDTIFLSRLVISSLLAPYLSRLSFTQLLVTLVSHFRWMQHTGFVFHGWTIDGPLPIWPYRIVIEQGSVSTWR